MITKNNNYNKISPYLNKLRVEKSGTGYFSLVKSNTQIKKMYDTEHNFIDYILFNDYEFIVTDSDLYVGGVSNTVKLSEINEIYHFYTPDELYKNNYLYEIIYTQSKKFIEEHEGNFISSVILERNIIPWLETISDIEYFKIMYKKKQKSKNFNL